ncbi:MAG: LAGLIDADG family homing endonuclease [Candidatus Aenigmatarchaeota archaeon]
MKFDLNNLSRKQMLKLLGVIALSDGSVHYSGKSIRLSTSITSKGQHELFRTLCLKVFKKEPKKYIISRKSFGAEALWSELFMRKAVEELYTLSPTFKTTPGKSSIKKYLNSKQPSIAFLLNESKHVKELAIRTWFDFDGSVVPSIKIRLKKDKKGNKIYRYYQVGFECEIQIAETNPTLANQILRLFNSLGIKSRIKYDKRKWSGIDGVSISAQKSVEKFVKLGPMTDIRVSAKSYRFNGIRKSVICRIVGQLFSDNTVRLSGSFTNKSKAIKYKRYLKSLLENRIKTTALSSSG